MKIAVVVPLRAGASGGALKHIHRLALEWEKLGEDISPTFYLPDGLGGFSGISEADVVKFPASEYWRGFRGLGAKISKGGYDVALIVTSRHVDTGNTPSVTMVRNSLPIQKPNYNLSLAWKARLWLLRRETLKACQKAEGIIAVSNYVKDCLYNVPGIGGKIRVIPHGIGEDEIADLGIPPDGAPQSGAFIFTAGSLLPYRGLEDLVGAYGELKKRGIDLPVVVVGGGPTNGEYALNIKKMASAFLVAEKFIWLGALDARRMNWCYKNCKFFVFTSRAEACPNIVLESMGNGCASISTQMPPMPEFYGDAALYYAPGDKYALASKLALLFHDAGAEIQKLKAAAKENTGRFTWEKSAGETLSFLKEIAGSHSHGG